MTKYTRLRKGLKKIKTFQARDNITCLDIDQIRYSRHLFFHASSTEKPATNRTVSNNSNAQFSGVHTVQLYQDSGVPDSVSVYVNSVPVYVNSVSVYVIQYLNSPA